MTANRGKLNGPGWYKNAGDRPPTAEVLRRPPPSVALLGRL
ncbi:MAG: hypothetical protein ABSD97_06850 [Acidimicrobiales bacterium]